MYYVEAVGIVCKSRKHYKARGINIFEETNE